MFSYDFILMQKQHTDRHILLFRVSNDHLHVNPLSTNTFRTGNLSKFPLKCHPLLRYCFITLLLPIIVQLNFLRKKKTHMKSNPRSHAHGLFGVSPQWHINYYKQTDTSSHTHHIPRISQSRASWILVELTGSIN